MAQTGSTLNIRNEADQSAPLGIATTRYKDRVAATLLGAGHAKAAFKEHEALCGAGLLFLLPALLAQGLLKTKEVYHIPQNHYYGLESVMLTLAFMALARIKNPEQLKQCKLGEIGKIIGLDRIPEVRCLREKIKFLSDQQQAQNLGKAVFIEGAIFKMIMPLPDGKAIAVNDTVNDTVKQRMTRVIQELVKQPGLKSKDLAKITGVSEVSIRRDMQKLTLLVEFRGAPKTGGYFPTDYMLSKLEGN